MIKIITGKRSGKTLASKQVVRHIKIRYNIFKIRPYFFWYNLWIGVHYDTAYKTLFIQLLPMIGIQVLLIRTVTSK